MLLRWQSKPRFDASRPASGRLPATSGRSISDMVVQSKGHSAQLSDAEHAACRSG